MGGRAIALLTALVATSAAACLVHPLRARAEGVGSEPSFTHEVMAVFSRAGCNAGTCHGNLHGKGGFKLSLRGQDPRADWLAVTHDQVGRRVNLADPVSSLVLAKPSLALAHEGGRRFALDSPEYELLRRWIASGASFDADQTAALAELIVTPVEIVAFEPESCVTLTAVARFVDEQERNVTGLCTFEASGSAVRVTSDGAIERARFGAGVVLVRYLERQVAVPVSFLPARAEPELADWPSIEGPPTIDGIVARRLRKLRQPPALLADDITFLRRSTLDALGLWPTADEARTLLADTRPDKRARWIEELLTRREFAQRWALKWADLLKVEEKTLDRKGVQAMARWLESQFVAGRPLDELARELLTAEGSTYLNPAANFYRAHRDPTSRAEAVAQVFLGARLQCARCHNHPYDVWTQDAYYGWAAVFAPIDYKIRENLRLDRNDKHEFVGEQFVFRNPAREVRDPRTDHPVAPRRLSWPPGPDDRRADLEGMAAWLVSPEHRAFARSQANRIWQHFVGRGLIEPVDDLRLTNPASEPALLEFLTDELIASGYDLRHLARLILNSRTYQLDSRGGAVEPVDETGLSRALVRRLSAEELLDSLSQVLGAAPKFNGYPRGLRAGQLPGYEAVRARDQPPSSADRFLRSFGKPPRLLNCECERVAEPTRDQALQMVSGAFLDELLTAGDNRLAVWQTAGASDAAVVDALFWWALSRPPSPEELIAALAALAQAANRRVALEDLAWGLVNSQEFLLRR